MLSKNNRVLALIAVMAASSVVVGAIVTVITTSQGSHLDTELTHLTVLRSLTHELALAVRDEESGLDDYVLSKDDAALERYHSAVDNEFRIVGQLRLAAADLPQLQSELDAMEAVSLGWQSTVAEKAIAAADLDDPVGLTRFFAQAVVDHEAVGTAVESLDSNLNAASDDLAVHKAEATTTTIVGSTVAFSVLLLAFGVALVAVRLFGHALEVDARQASILNRFTEVTTFADDDHDVAATNLIAIGRLASPDASVTHILNRSQDRAVPEASTGDAVAEILSLRALERCAGVVRGAMHVTDDLSDDLSVRCPVYPQSTGTLACIPLISGEPLGAVHLSWARPNALPLSARPNISRITEHAALAIGNRRMLAALHGQANTDPRTGLANSRAFDLALEGALSTRAMHENLSVLMIDVDHFKKFNDRHGHPAGDEALRAFGGVLRSCMREGDVAARYGGEEFAVLLRGIDISVASVIAERIRERTESTIIALAPGMTDRITVSIGIASAPDQGLDRVALLRIADEALYRAKAAGRNRVGGNVGPSPQAFTPTGGEDVGAKDQKRVMPITVPV